MGQPSADNPDALFKVHDAELDASVARAELRNAKALADKLQTLLDSKTHAYEAMHNEAQHLSNRVEALQKDVADLGAKLKAANSITEHWKERAQDAELDRAGIAGVLIMHADGDFLAIEPTTLDVAKHIIDKLITAPEPDIDTVPLADLLEAVGTYLEHDQAVTIRGSYEAVRQVELHAMGLTFSVDTHEASEALTKLQELGGCLVQD